ncbi:MAG: MFS transporter [Nitrospirae bacterium YQR-1]
MTTSSAKKTFYIFSTVSSIWAVVYGFIGPYFVIKVKELSDGVEKLGIAFGIMIFLQAVSSYFSGHYADKVGRKPILIATAVVEAVTMFLYTIVTQTYQLYILQAILGITNGVMGTIKTVILGDITIREFRGQTVGKFQAAVSFASAAGVALSGYMVKYLGINYLFYLASAVVILSSLLLFFMKDEG